MTKTGNRTSPGTPRFVAAILALAAGALGCASADDPSQGNNRGPSSLEQPDSATGASASGNASAALVDPQSVRGMLERSAAVVEALVRGVRHDYDETHGPRTTFELEVGSVYFGSLRSSRIDLAFFGGPTPDGRTISTSISFGFVEGGRYVLFLRNGGWFYTPLAATALRVERVGEREVLVDPRGSALFRVTGEGFRFRSEPLFESNAGVASLWPRANLVAEPHPRALAGALNRAAFRELLAEAIRVEATEPSGNAVLVPEQRANWRVTPTVPDPAVPTTPSDPSAPTDPGALEPEGEPR